MSSHNATTSLQGGAGPSLHLRTRLEQWWASRFQPVDQLTLTQRNIYVLPNRVGLLLLATLLALLIGAINYQLNLGYLLTFLLAGSSAMALFVGHANLRGLELHLMRVEDAFAGGVTKVHVELVNPSKQSRYAIRMSEGATAPGQVVDVPAGSRMPLVLQITADKRGQHALPLLRLQTGFPIGVFRIWSLWLPRSQALVYPQAERNPPPLPLGLPTSGSGAPSAQGGTGEYDGVRSYRAGDPLKTVVWKKFAKSGELVSRDSVQTDRRQLWLTWQSCGALATEERLSRLTAWVLLAEQQGLNYGLQLPHVEIQPDHGHAHRLRCLQALAQW